MVHLAFLLSGLIAVVPGDSTTQTPTAPRLTPAETLSAYNAQRARAGPDAGAQINLALWCETHGLMAERTKHLARAVLIEPGNVLARGLLGMLDDRGRWETPEAVAEKVKADETLTRRLAEYNTRRTDLEDRFQDHPFEPAVFKRQHAARHVRLGMWCEANGLQPEATAHLIQALVLAPSNDATWKHLGYVKHDGRWMTPAQIAADQQLAVAQRRATKSWEPLLRKWRSWLADENHRAKAVGELSALSDPLAITAVWNVFGKGNGKDQEVAVRLLGQIDSAESTRALVRLAFLGASESVRTEAMVTLRSREPRDYVPPLLAQIHGPIHFEIQPVRGPGSPGALLVETPRFKMLRTYDAPPAFHLGITFSGYVGYDSNGLPVVVRGTELSNFRREGGVPSRTELAAIEARTAQVLAEANLKAVVSQQRLLADVNAIEAANAESAAISPQIAAFLRETLDAPNLGTDEDAWNVWWNDRLGYRYAPPPQQTLTLNASPQVQGPDVYSCFVAGTPVRTLNGRRPIESLAVGDQVLAQDTADGTLSFQPVVAVYHNPPAETIRLRLDNGDELTASVHHRFWRAGLGWAMARELKANDTLRTFQGLTRVVSAERGEVVPVFNLNVAHAHTFFVGTKDALVHDNTLPAPRQVRFDAIPQKARTEPKRS